MDEMITIKKSEYLSLQLDSILLSNLEGCGVDNWDGWGDAYAGYEKDCKDIKEQLAIGQSSNGEENTLAHPNCPECVGKKLEVAPWDSLTTKP